MDNTVEKQDKPDEKYFDEGGKGTIKDKDANQKDTNEFLASKESHHKGSLSTGGLHRDSMLEKHLKSMQGDISDLCQDEPITRKRSSLSPRHECIDEFNEFIKLNKKGNKYNHQMEQKLDVTDINHIVFEESDGTEIHFSDLFEYRASIGAGGFGFVVAALDRLTGEEIAIKILKKIDVENIVIELFK